jgi:transposase
MLGHASAMTLDTYADLFDDDLADSVRTDSVIVHPLTSVASQKSVIKLWTWRVAGAAGRPKAELTLSVEERETLQRWARRPKSAQALALRSKIVLACATGATNLHVAEQLAVDRMTVGRWRTRFLAHRLAGLTDEPRPGAPRTITVEQVEAVIVKTLESKPSDATHWSTRSMAAATGMSQTAVSRIWRAFALKPHLQETFKLSTDPQFVEKVRDIVGLYLNPPEAALVLCVDEKTQVQALDRSAPVLPMMPGTPERVTHDYQRAGTTDLFAALNVATGKVIAQLRDQHRTTQFKAFLAKIDKQVPADLTVHVICDNLPTHKTEAIRRWLVRHPRFRLHFIPTGSSRLNLVERWFAEITANSSAAAYIAPSRIYKPTSPAGPSNATTTHDRTCGPRPPIRSSNPSPHIVSELTTQDG